MSVINGSLFGGIVSYHNPTLQASTAAIVIDEMDDKWSSEIFENFIIRKKSQQDTLRFCKELGCKVIVVHEFRESHPKHIYDIIKNL